MWDLASCVIGSTDPKLRSQEEVACLLGPSCAISLLSCLRPPSPHQAPLKVLSHLQPCFPSLTALTDGDLVPKCPTPASPTGGDNCPCQGSLLGLLGAEEVACLQHQHLPASALRPGLLSLPGSCSVGPW